MFFLFINFLCRLSSIVFCFLFSLLYLLLSRTSGSRAKGTGYTWRASSWLQTYRGSCLLSQTCFLRSTSPGKRSWLESRGCPMPLKQPHGSVRDRTRCVETWKFRLVNGERHRQNNKPCFFNPEQICWRRCRRTTVCWMRYRNLWKLTWSLRESSSQGAVHRE